MYVVIMQLGYRAQRPDTRMHCDNVKKQISHFFLVHFLFTLSAILLSKVINTFFFDQNFLADTFKIHSRHDIL
jgi:hypothetical protein